MPDISIIVPIYNAARHLAQTLESVQAQTLSNWELIAVDDGSTDDSADIARAFADRDPRIRLVRQPNAGVAAARNRGYAESAPAAPYVIFLDNDDLWQEDTLALLHQVLHAHPAYAATHGRARYIDADSRPCLPDQNSVYFASLDAKLKQRATVVDSIVEPCPDAPETSFATFAVTNCIVSPGIALLRRAALPADQVFDVRAAPCDDWDLYLRLTRRAPFGYVPQAVLKYRLHPANASRNQEAMTRAGRYVVYKTLTSLENTPRQRRDMEVSLTYFDYLEANTRLGWMRDSLRRGQILAAIQQARHASRVYLRARKACFRAANVSFGGPQPTVGGKTTP